MTDVECPYCGHEQDINHDDGYGYKDGDTYKQECGNCGKTFVYTTCITFDYEVFEAPCQNGEPHKLVDVRGHPKEAYQYKKQCEYCSDTIITDQAAYGAAWKAYFDSLAEKKAAETALPKS